MSIISEGTSVSSKNIEMVTKSLDFFLVIISHILPYFKNVSVWFSAVPENRQKQKTCMIWPWYYHHVWKKHLKQHLSVLAVTINYLEGSCKWRKIFMWCFLPILWLHLPYLSVSPHLPVQGGSWIYCHCKSVLLRPQDWSCSLCGSLYLIKWFLCDFVLK